MSAVDYMAQELERRARPFARALLDAAEAGNVQAAALLLDRVHGKVAEKVETTSTAEGLTLPELRALRAQLLAEHPELGRLKVVGE